MYNPTSWVRALLVSGLVFAAMCLTAPAADMATPATSTLASDFFQNESWLRDDGTVIVGPFVRVESRTIDVVDMSDGPKSSMRPITIQRIKQTPKQQGKIQEFENRLEKLRRGVPTSRKVNVEEVAETVDDLAVQRFTQLKPGTSLGIYCTRTHNGLLYAAGETRDGVPHGLFVCFYPTGRVRFIDFIEDGHKIVRQIYHKNGRIAKVATFNKGQMHGVITGWYDDGTIAAISMYQDGKLHGLTVLYAPNGKPAESFEFSNGQQVKYTAYLKDDRDFKPIEDFNNETSQETFKKLWKVAAN